MKSQISIRTHLLNVLGALLGIGVVLAAPAQTNPEQILLKDFRPKPLYQIPQTKVSKARFAAIDMHVHDYVKTEPEMDNWVKTMDKVGIQKVELLTMAVGAKFDAMTAWYKKHPDRFDLWCGIDYAGYDKPGFGPTAVAELERCHATGAIGVGELVDKGQGLYGAPGMHPDDPRMDPIWEKCSDLHMLVSLHVADPIWFYQPMDRHNDGLMNAYHWRLDNQTNNVGHQAMIDSLERTLKKHPRTIFIACHLASCSYDLSILGRLLDRHPNLYADNSARYAETAAIPRYVTKFYEQYQDRLLYGTDMGVGEGMYQDTFRILETEDEHFYSGLFTYHWPLHGFGLSSTVLKKVYRDNAQKLLDRGK